jgi:hypothetical protein
LPTRYASWLLENFMRERSPSAAAGITLTLTRTRPELSAVLVGSAPVLLRRAAEPDVLADSADVRQDRILHSKNPSTGRS